MLSEVYGGPKLLSLFWGLVGASVIKDLSGPVEEVPTGPMVCANMLLRCLGRRQQATTKVMPLTVSCSCLILPSQLQYL